MSLFPLNVNSSIDGRSSTAITSVSPSTRSSMSWKNPVLYLGDALRTFDSEVADDERLAGRDPLLCV
jgi:hypothetical protein